MIFKKTAFPLHTKNGTLSKYLQHDTILECGSTGDIQICKTQINKKYTSSALTKTSTYKNYSDICCPDTKKLSCENSCFPDV